MNNDFQWSDDLVEEFEIFYNKIPYAITGTNPIQKGIEMFKASKEGLISPAEPSFKTENGVEVPYGSYIIMLDTQSWSHSYVRIISNQQINDRFKFFSTREAAEDYTIMNKPILSVNDVFKQDVLNKFDGITILKKDVVELAKSKITNP